ncbi:MAG: recombinase family protein [Phycisphaerales bacterium]
MRVVALFRVSTEKQAEEGSSLESQQRMYHEHATKNGWKTVAEFKGHESATQAASDRRVLQQVLACIREESPDAVYVHEQSRLTRGDKLEVAMLFRELEERNVKVIVGGVVRSLANLDDSFMLDIQSAVDRAESRRIKERLVRGKREKARRGLKTGGPAPLGYRNAPPGAPGRGTLTVVPEEAVVVRKIFDLAARGLGINRIVRDLNQAGIASPRGVRWGKTTVRNILKNRAYIGVSCAGVWVAEKGSRNFRLRHDNATAVIVPDAHEAIIDRATWDAVHGRQRLPRALVPRMLTGLLFVDGSKFAGDWNKGTAYYRAARGTHGSPWLQAGLTDDAVWDAFVSLATTPEFVEGLLERASDPGQQEVVRLEIAYLEDQVGKTKRRLERLVEMRADGEIDRDHFMAKSAETRSAIERLQADLAEQRAKAVVFDGTHARRVVHAVQTLLAGKTRLTTQQKSAILRAIVRRVDVVACATGAVQQRGERGGFGAATGPRWGVQSVSFQLALPPATSPRGATGERDGANPPAAADAPTGQTHRGGQKVTTLSCSGRRAPARR